MEKRMIIPRIQIVDVGPNIKYRWLVLIDKTYVFRGSSDTECLDYVDMLGKVSPEVIAFK